MSADLLKILSAVAILVVALSSGFLPLRLGTTHRGRRLLMLGSAFAAGVFLGAGLIHLLGDGQENFAELGTGGDFPLALALCGFGLLFVLLIEKVAAATEETEAAKVRQPYLLLSVLSVHSLIAGASLGLEGATGAYLMILVAILAHKGFAAFSLGVSFVEAALPVPKYRRLLVFFSFTTPLGVILGTLAASALHDRTAVLFEGVFDGLAAGTFLYVATMDLMSETFAERSAHWGKFASVALGFGLMALLAVWT